MKHFQKGSAAPIVIIIAILVIAAALYYLSTTGNTASFSDINNAEIFCKDSGEFMASTCLSAVAFYNHDVSVCDNINAHNIVDAAYKAELISRCMTHIQTGEVMLKKLITGVYTEDTQNSDIAACQKKATEQGLTFRRVISGSHPASFYVYLSGAKGKAFGVISCYGFK